MSELAQRRSRRDMPRGRAVVGLALVLGLVAGDLGAAVAAGAAFTTPFTVSRVSQTAGGVASDGTDGVDGVALSGDGAVSAFLTDARNLATDPYDRHAYVARGGAPDPVGGQTPFSAGAVELDGDGDVVTFTSTRSNLDNVHDRTASGFHLYVWQRSATGTFRLVSDRGGSALPTGASYEPRSSGDAMRVVFWTEAGDMGDGATGPRYIVADLSGDAPVLRTLGTTGSPLPLAAAISTDGTRAAWLRSDTGPDPDAWHLMTADLTGNAITPVDHGVVPVTSTSPMVPFPAAPSLTADGDTVVVPALDGGGHGVVLSIGLGTPAATTTIDVTPGTPDQNITLGPIGAAQVSGDGQYIAWIGSAIVGGELANSAVWRYDVDEPATVLASVGADRAANDGYASRLDVDHTGTAIAFTSVAQNLAGSAPVPQAYVARVADPDPPTWPAAGAVAVTAMSGTTATLSWPAADGGPTGYVLTATRSGETVADVTEEIGAATGPVSATLDGLHPQTTYTFAVVARDAVGNRSTPLQVQGTTTDINQGPPAIVPLQAAARPDGTVALTWAPVETEGFGEYRVLRGTGTGALAVIDTLTDPATGSHTDTGVDPSTAYRYQVELVRSQGAAYPLTPEVTVTTVPLTIGAVTWSGGSGGRLAIGEGISVTFSGSPGRTASAVLAIEEWVGGARVVDTIAVAVSENAGTPGTYTGHVNLPAGTAALTAVTGRLTTGSVVAEASTAAGLPKDLDGQVDVAVTGEFTSASISVRGADPATNPGSRFLTGPGSSTFRRVVPGTYTVDMWVGGTSRRPAAQQVQVRPGLATAVAMAQPAPATLVVDVEGPPGTDRAGDVRIETLDGQILAWGFQGPSHRFTDLAQGTTVRIRSSATSPEVQRQVTADVLLGGAETVAAMVHPLLPRATVSGVVERRTGVEPIPGAWVTLTQLVQGRTQTVQAQTDADGRYVLAGAYQLPGTMAVSYGWEPRVSTAVTIAGASQVVDLVKPGPLTYPVDLQLWTQYQGSAIQGPLTFAPETAHHYHLQLSTPTMTLRQGQVHDRFMSIRGNPGETVRFCANGYEVQLGAGCVTRVLPDDPPPSSTPLPLRLELVQPGVATVQLRAPDGTPYTGPWSVFAPDEPTRLASGLGSTVEVRIDQTVDHLVIEAPGHRPAILDGPIATGGRVDLGDVTLRTTTPLLTAASVLPTRAPVAPGSPVEVRVDWRTADPWGDVVLDLDLPDAATLVPGSVLLDGAPVTAVDGTVPIADGGSSHTVRFRALPATGAPSLTVTPTLRGRIADAPVEEVVDALTVGVVAVTLDAPPTARTHTLTLSGRTVPSTPTAPTTVTVLDGTTVLAQATASEGGIWEAEVRLPDRGEEVHLLQASVVLGGQTHSSAQTELVIDASEPVLEWIAVSQPERPRTQVSLADGVPRFPYVWIPHRPVHVEAHFTDPDRVVEVEVRIGDASAPATYDPDAGDDGEGAFVAVFTELPRGRITVSYEVLPEAWQPPSMPGGPEDPAVGWEERLADVLARLPAAWGDAEVIGEPTSTVAGGVTTFTVRLRLPALDDAELTYTLTTEELPDYEPPTDDVVSGDDANTPDVYEPVGGIDPETGLPDMEPVRVDGGDPTSTEDDGGVIRFGGTILREDLPPTPEAQQQFARAAFAGVTRYQVNGITSALREIGEAEFARYSALDGALSAVDGGQQGDAVGSLYDDLAVCTESVRSQFKPRIDTLLNRSMASAGVSASLNVAGLFGGFAGASGSFVAGKAFDATFTAATNAAVERLRGEIQNACEAAAAEDQKRNEMCDTEAALVEAGIFDKASLLCERQRARRPRPRHEVPGADPIWAYDPSGYTYDGVPSNRLSGVTAILQHAEDDDGPWATWDASAFGQHNPLVTDEAGRYAWDVPEGWWRVVYQRAGYEIGFSEPLPVLPPQLDVNEAMRPLALPSLTTAIPRSGGIRLTFDQHMVPASVQSALTVTGPSGPVAGSLAPVAAEAGEDGTPLATTYDFTPAAPLAPATTYDVVLVEGASSWTGRSSAPATRSITTAAASGGGGDGGGGSGGGGGTPNPTPTPTPTPGTDEPPATDVPRTVTVPLDGGPGQGSDVSITMSRIAFPDDTGTDFAQSGEVVEEVLLASEVVFADALASGPLQAQSPLLLTDPASLEPSILDEVRRLGARRVRILGGVAAVGEEVQQQLEAAGLDVVRTAGVTRLETAVAIAELAAGGEGGRSALLARAFPDLGAGDPTQAFADALAAGGWAAATGRAILLTETPHLSTPTGAQLASAGIDRLDLVGGEAAISAGAADQAAQLVGDVRRTSGPTRFHTAVAVAAARGHTTARPPSRVVVVDGQGPSAWTAGFTAAAASARLDAPILLANGDRLPAPTVALLSQIEPAEEGTVLVCAAATAACDTARELLGLPG